MPDLLRAEVSFYNGSTNPKPVTTLTVGEVLSAIQDGTYQRPVQTLRDLLQAGRQADYDRAKRRLRAVTFGGTFEPSRARANLAHHTGLVHGDLDHLEDVEAAKQILRADPYVVYFFTSPSGSGIKMGVRISPVTDDATYKHAWQAAADYYGWQYGIAWDPTGKDISRLCYLSYDPSIYINLSNPLFPVPPRVVSPPQRTAPYRNSPLMSADRRNRYAEQAIQTAVQMIQAAPMGTRHHTRLKAGSLLGGFVAGGLLSEDRAYGALAQALVDHTEDLERALKTVEDGLAYGQANPITLEALEAERQAWLDHHFAHHRNNSVHHTNEMAQTEACHSTRLANFWLHGSFLQLDDAKMAKSAGDFVRLQTVVERGYDALAYRFFCLSAHYRDRGWNSEAKGDRT